MIVLRYSLVLIFLMLSLNGCTQNKLLKQDTACSLPNKPVVYPPESVAANEQGKTSLKFMVNAEGVAKFITVNQSSGFPRLDQATIEYISQRCFKPYIKDGVAIDVWVIFPQEFKITD